MPTSSPKSEDAQPSRVGRAEVGYRVLCDAVAGGLLAVFSGVFCVLGINAAGEWGFGRVWLLVLAGLLLLGAVTLLWGRSATDRRLAMATHTLAIVQVAATMVWLFFSEPWASTEVFWMMSLLAGVPAIAFALLYVDHCFAGRLDTRSNPPPLRIRTRALRATASVVVGLMLMTTACSAVWIAFPLAKQAYRLTWPRAEATIVRSEVVPRELGEPARVDVEYAYQINGARYVGSRLSELAPRVFNRTTKSAERLASRLPLGGTLPVAYDAGDPSRSLLFPGISNHESFALLHCCWYASFLIVSFHALAARESRWLAGQETTGIDSAFFGGYLAEKIAIVGVITFGLASYAAVVIGVIATELLPGFAWSSLAWALAIALTWAVCRCFYNREIQADLSTLEQVATA